MQSKRVDLINEIKEQLYKMSSIAIDSDELISKELIELLLLIAETNDSTILYAPETVALILNISQNKFLRKAYPGIANLYTEITCKMMRFPLFMNIDLKANISDIYNYEDELLASCGVMENERILPSYEGEFELPPKGELNNLTITAPSSLNGKVLIREVMIDHEGYIKEIINQHWEDVYTDESEEIYNTAYLEMIKNEQKKQTE